LNPPAQAELPLETAPESRAESADVRSSERKRVPISDLLSWGPPVSALAAPLLFLQFFFLKFATDVLLIAPGIIGAIFAAGRLWDAISDPIVGTWSDRTHTRLGRRRPWMLIGIPLLSITLLMIWIPPAALSGGALVAWVAVSLFGFYTAYTIYAVPHQALGSELSTDYHDRSRIFGVYNASFMIGMMCAFGGMQYVLTSEDQREAAVRLAIPAALAIVAILLIPPTRLRERPEYQGRGAASSFHAMRDVLRNRHAQRLLFVQFVQMLGTGVVGILSPYLVVYILKRPDLVGPLPGLFVLFNLLSIPAWLFLSRRFGKRAVWVFAMVAAGLVFGAMTFVGEGDVWLIALLLPLAGFALGCGGTVGPSILADVIDGDELETGQRKEGAYNAAWGFAFKSSNALMILVASLVLQAIGFEPNVEQSDFAKLAIRALYGLMPLSMFLLAALVLRGFRLDEAEHASIRAALDARRR
jgi:GPH family glycoside/pentoside/hexuronide:cation symporter